MFYIHNSILKNVCLAILTPPVYKIMQYAQEHMLSAGWGSDFYYKHTDCGFTLQVLVNY